MKKLFILLFLLVSIVANSQNTSQYDNILLNNAADYRKAEPQVVLASDYVYSTPIDKENINRTNAISFIIKWMSGTSDFSFTMDEATYKIANSDKEVLGVYFSCLVKYALSKGKGVDREDLKYNSFVLLANYCENPENNYKPRGEIKKLIEAKNQGKLREFLDSKKK